MNIKRFSEICMWVLIYTVFAALGFIFGMIFQQQLIVAQVGQVLSYTDLDLTVNFNTTKFIQEFNNTILPELNKTFSQNFTK